MYDKKICIADENKGRDHRSGGAEGANKCESLRQKDSCLTQLWRVFT